MNRRFISFCCAVLCAITLSATTIDVAPGSGTLKSAVNAATAGDILILTEGTYTESSVKPAVALTIKAAEGTHPIISLTSRFEIKADFTLQGVQLESTGEAIRMVPGSSPYNVTVKDCELKGCPSYFIRAYNTDQTSPYINNLTIDNCVFLMGSEAANTARGIAATKTPNQLGNLIVRNSTFDGGANGTGRIIYLHSGDENAVIPLQGVCEVDHCTFYNTTDTRGVYLANIGGSHVTNCIFMNANEVAGGVSFALYGSESHIENCLTWLAPVKLSRTAISNWQQTALLWLQLQMVLILETRVGAFRQNHITMTMIRMTRTKSPILWLRLLIPSK